VGVRTILKEGAERVNASEKSSSVKVSPASRRKSPSIGVVGGSVVYDPVTRAGRLLVERTPYTLETRAGNGTGPLGER